MKSTLASALARSLAVVAGAAVASGAQAQGPAFHAGVDPSVAFPDAASATLAGGVFANPANVRLVAPGMSKDNVYLLLGVPHFHEGLFGVRRWNYILKFYTGEGDHYLSCQYQIRYGEHVKVVGAWWKDQACADLVNPPAAAPAPPPAVAAVTERPPEPAAAAAPSFVVYFPFDRADLDDLAQAVVRAAAKAASGKTIKIVGYTDTSGPESYDQTLSARRARAVADALATLGLPAEKITTEARGKSDLAVPTADGVKEPLNRRAVVTIGL